MSDILEKIKRGLASNEPPSPEQLKAREEMDEARARYKARKNDTRRKIIVGSIVLESIIYDYSLALHLTELLNSRLYRDSDREQVQDLLALKVGGFYCVPSHFEDKQEVRRKIIVGSTILNAIGDNSVLSGKVKNLLNKYVSHDSDREIIADLVNI